MQQSSLAAAGAAAAPQPASMQRNGKQAASAGFTITIDAGSSDFKGSSNSSSNSSSSNSSSSSAVKQHTEKPEDVYALTVEAIMSGVKGVRLAHVLLGMLITVALQLGMLCLLWHIVTTPAPNGGEYETFPNESDGQNNTNLIVNLLALMAIAVLVHNEVRRAAALCRKAAIVAGILPHFYATDSNIPLQSDSMVYTSNRNMLLRLAMLCAPLLQLVTALLVLLSATVLSITSEVQSSNIQVIINSVALGFVLEVDNTVGRLLTVQHEQWLASHAAGSSDSSPSSSKSPFRCFKGQQLAACMGHAYFAILGLLLSLEPVLLAPHAAILVLILVVKAFDSMGVVNQEVLSNYVRAPKNTWSFYLAMDDGSFSTNWFEGSTDWYKAYLTISAATPVYALLLVGFVLLVFYKPLPSAARRWPQALLALQAGTAFVAAMYSIFPFMLLMHPPTAFLVVCTWVCMFIIWPTCHKEPPCEFELDSKRAEPRCCCHGDCKNCCTICCSSGCGTSCGVRCGICCAAC